MSDLETIPSKEYNVVITRQKLGEVLEDIIKTNFFDRLKKELHSVISSITPDINEDDVLSMVLESTLKRAVKGELVLHGIPKVDEQEVIRKKMYLWLAKGYYYTSARLARNAMRTANKVVRTVYHDNDQGDFSTASRADLSRIYDDFDYPLAINYAEAMADLSKREDYVEIRESIVELLGNTNEDEFTSDNHDLVFLMTMLAKSRDVILGKRQEQALMNEFTDQAPSNLKQPDAANKHYQNLRYAKEKLRRKY